MPWPRADWPEKGYLQGKQNLVKPLRDVDVHARILHALIGRPCHILGTGDADTQDPNCAPSQLLLSPHRIAVLGVSVVSPVFLPYAPWAPAGSRAVCAVAWPVPVQATLYHFGC